MERENPFKKIGNPNREVPKELKEKVMSEIASLKLVTDIAALFTSNYQSTITTFFKAKKKILKITINKSKNYGNNNAMERTYF